MGYTLAEHKFLRHLVSVRQLLISATFIFSLVTTCPCMTCSILITITHTNSFLKGSTGWTTRTDESKLLSRARTPLFFIFLLPRRGVPSLDILHPHPEHMPHSLQSLSGDPNSLLHVSDGRVVLNVETRVEEMRREPRTCLIVVFFR